VSDPDFAALSDESAGGVVGPLLYALLRKITGRVVARYPPGVYSPNRQSRWDDDAVLEVVHECVARRLQRTQLRLLFAYAHDLDALCGALGRRVRQTLLDIRVTDVVDNVLARVWKELAARPGTTENASFGCATRWRLRTRTAAPSPPSRRLWCHRSASG
jgi:hypothetical protein